MKNMAVKVVEFSNGGWGTKLERFLPKNQHTKRKLLKDFKIQSFKSQLFLSSQKKELPQIEIMAKF